MEIRPITFRDAKSYVFKHHRHLKHIAGCKFCIGIYKQEELVGVAICGRPVIRYLDNGLICEITRLCTNGTYNACSMLYSACVRIAKHMGYHKIITYIRISECGSSLKASNFTCEGLAGGTHWTGVRNRGQEMPWERKLLWGQILNCH